MVVAPVYDDYLPQDYSIDNLAVVYQYDAERVVRNDAGDIIDSYCMGFIDMNGKLVVPCLYSTIYSGNDGVPVLEEMNGAWPLSTLGKDGLRRVGCIDKKGRIVVPFEYQSFRENETTGMVEFIKGDKKTLYGRDWKVVREETISQ